MINYLIFSAITILSFILMIVFDSKHLAKTTLLLLATKVILFPIFTLMEMLIPFVFMGILLMYYKLTNKYFYFDVRDSAIRVICGKFRLEFSKKLTNPLFRFDVDDEGDITLCYWLGINVYFSYENRMLTKFIEKQKYSTGMYSYMPERELRVTIHDGYIWFNFWDNENDKRSWHVNLLGWRGKHIHEKIIKGADVNEVCFPEGQYTLLTLTWQCTNWYKNLWLYYKLFGKKSFKVKEVKCIKLKKDLPLHEVQNTLDDYIINYKDTWISENFKEETEDMFEDMYIPNGSTKYGVDGGTNSIWFGSHGSKEYFDAVFEFYMSIMKERIKNQGYCWTPKSEDNG